MHVDSYLEIFTTLYGWAFANIIGETLTGTGLFALPFLMLAFQAWREAKESAAGGASATGLSESIQVKIILSLFVFTFAFCTTPFTSLANLRYYPPNATQPVDNRPGVADENNNPYGQSMPQVSSISSTGSLSNVPMWWYLVMALSAGMNDSLRGGITNAGSSMRDVEALGRLAAINDPTLKSDINRFYSECYSPARSQYHNTDQNKPDQFDAASKEILADSKYGATDINWMGSRVFVTDSHFYPARRSYKRVIGFVNTTDPNCVNVGTDQGAPAPTPTDCSRPTCYDWWMDPAKGLRARIVEKAPPTYWQTVKGAFSSSTQDEQMDLVARTASINSAPMYIRQDEALGRGGASLMGNIMEDLATVAGSPYVYGSQFRNAIAYNHMTSAMFMGQAIILMAIYMLLPMIVLLSGYKLEVMFYGAMAIFTVKFWTVLWYVANWFENHLMTAMYPDGSKTPGDFFNYIAHGSLYKASILSIIEFGMYVGFPLIWSGMMGWIGIQVGSVLSRMLAENAHPANNKTGMGNPIMDTLNLTKKFVK